MATQKKDNGLEAALPMLATAALNGAGLGDETLKAYLTELLGEAVEAKRKERERKERLALSAVENARQEAAQREEQERLCNHLKQDDTTRLVGQKLTGTNQISLVCQFCGKNFFIPPIGNQVPPPRHLIPRFDEIGG